ncbi:hypothetical protein Hamer_G024567 [Homarus americanus]|uniref:Uncharacterized protein n=1 Tax=Homarus americanus TaxID=6706 RepID=A0A8J5TN57_HOMAM|nr:hypothetical protein Hamer_G024567 [Homarus americanus]
MINGSIITSVNKFLRALEEFTNFNIFPQRPEPGKSARSSQGGEDHVSLPPYHDRRLYKHQNHPHREQTRHACAHHHISRELMMNGPPPTPSLFSFTLPGPDA